MSHNERAISEEAGGGRSRPGNGGGCGRRCWRWRTAGCCPRSPSPTRSTTAAPAPCAGRSARRIRPAGANTIDFDSTRVQHAADDHPDRHPARAERHDRDGDDHGPGGGRDGQRRRAEPGVPGRRECHGVDLGTDDHRRHGDGNGGGLSNMRHDHADQLHRQRQLRQQQRRRPVQRSGTTTLTNCTVSGNSASFGGGGLYNYGGTTTLTNCTVSGNSASEQRRRPVQLRRHDHADQLHRQRQLRLGNGGGLYNSVRHDHADQLHRQRQLRRASTAAACTTMLRHGHADQLHRQRQLRRQQRRRPVQRQRHDHADQLHRQRQLRQRQRRRPGQLRRHDHADQLHRQRQLRQSNGGGLYNDADGTTTLTDCTVSGNSAAATAAACSDAIRHDHADQLHRQRQLRQQERRRPVQRRTTGTTTLTNCTVSGNSAGATAAACTTATYGTATLGNTIVAGNTAATGPDVAGGPSLPRATT